MGDVQYVSISIVLEEYKKNPSLYLLQRVGDVRLHLRVLCKDQTGQQGGALLGRQRAQSVLEQQLSEQELVAADLTGDAAL